MSKEESSSGCFPIFVTVGLWFIIWAMTYAIDAVSVELDKRLDIIEERLDIRRPCEGIADKEDRNQERQFYLWDVYESDNRPEDCIGKSK